MQAPSTTTHQPTSPHKPSNPPISPSHLAPTQASTSKDGTTPKKPIKRIIPEKIAEVGEWKVEIKGKVADEKDNAETSTEDAKSG